jgi:hypothetical protein
MSRSMKRPSTMSEYGRWLDRHIDELDRLYENLDPHEGIWLRCATIAHTAGDIAARLGLSDLHEKSMEFGAFADIKPVKSFLARCIAACQTGRKVPRRLALKDAAIELGYSASGMRKLVKRRGIQFSQDRKHAPIYFLPEWLHDYTAKHSIVSGSPATKRRSKAHRSGRYGFDASLLN